MHDRTEDEHAKEIGTSHPRGPFPDAVTTEYVFSVGQEQRSTGFLSKSELREVFHVDETNKDCMERMVSECRSTCSPHRAPVPERSAQGNAQGAERTTIHLQACFSDMEKSGASQIPVTEEQLNAYKEEVTALH
ncbi:MAG: hypothetical protein IPN38_10555 [Flavobacteriales bacterium]|nr:hypothetical protein [Flavobacteriales bacterium]